MKLAVRAKALGKKLTLMTTAFVLAVSSLTALTPFVLAEKASAVGGSSVSVHTEAELVAAASDQTVTTIGIANDINLSTKLVLAGRNVTVDGNGNALTFNGAVGWHGEYVFQAYKNLVEVKNLAITGGDAAIYANGATVRVKNVDVSGNEFGGIEVSQGSGVTTQAVLNVTGSITNTTEATGLPTVWTDDATNANATVTGPFTKTTHISGNANVQFQYYLVPANADITATNTTTGETFASLQAAINDADTLAGHVISLNKDVTTNAQVTVNKAVTINGNNHTVTGSFVKANNGNNSVIGVWSDNVTINDLVVDAVNGTTNQLHGINVFEANNVNLNNITARNGRSGVAVNASTVTIDGISTSGNVWHGVNVDKPGAHLTIKGANSHGEVLALYADDKTIGLVDDVDAQYATVDNFLKPGDRAYRLKLATPVLESPSNNGYTTSNVFDFEWSDVSGAVSYEFQNSLTGANVNGVLSNINYSATSGVSKLHSSGAADGSVRYWQVRAVDTFGAKSDWSAPWKMTIDMTAPTAPTLTSPVNNAFVNGNPVQKWSHGNPADVDHYVYESYSDEALTNLVYGTDVNGTQRTVGGTQSVVIWWRVAAVDDAGNQSPWSETRKLTIDNSNPTVVLNDVGTNPVGGTVSIEGSVADNFALSHYNLSLYNGTVDLSDGGTHASDRIATGTEWVTGGQTNVTGTDVVVARSLDTTALADGVYQIRLAAKDKAGNLAVQYFSFEVDNTDPIVTLNNLSTTSTSPVLTGTVDDPNATVTVLVGTTPFVATNNGDGTWSLTLTSVAIGSYPVTVTAADLAGNSSVIGGTLSVVTTTNTNTGGSGTDDADDETTTTTVSVALPGTTGPVDQAALGANDEADNDGTPAVEGTSTEKNLAAAVNNTDGSAFGLAWYWWLLIVAGLATILWWIIAAARRRQEEN